MFRRKYTLSYCKALFALLFVIVTSSLYAKGGYGGPPPKDRPGTTLENELGLILWVATAIAIVAGLIAFMRYKPVKKETDKRSRKERRAKLNS